MFDLPPQMIEQPDINTSFIAKAELDESFSSEYSYKAVRSIMQEKSKEILELYKDGFQWSDVAAISGITLEFLKKYQSVTLEEKKEMIMTTLIDLIDTTDTPYLPDSYTDPLFKAMVPPLIDILLSADAGILEILPHISDEKPSPKTFQTYANELKASFGDGFQWSDLGVALKSSIEFVSGYHNLTKDEKRQSTVDIVNFIIDATDMPMLPDMFLDPIFKALLKPMVEKVFDYLYP